MWLINICKAILDALLKKKTTPIVVVTPVDTSSPPLPYTLTIDPSTLSTPPKPMPEKETLKWGTKEEIRHSIRVICDEVGMSVDLKNKMAATIYGESEYNLNAVCLNLSNGTSKSTTYDKMAATKAALEEKGIRVKSTDFGLCQWNDFYHADEMPPQEAIHSPERAVRLMAYYWVKSETHRRWWIAYKSGRYKQFITLTSNPM